MAATGIVQERTARRISPAFFIAAIVCFFFTFAGVSCNTTAARSALQGLSSLGGSSSSTSNAQLDSCLNALGGVNLISYSGFNLAFGTSPGALTTTPSGCPQSSSLPAGTSTPNSDQAKLGVQPLELAGFIAIVVGALVTGLGAFRLLRAPVRGLLTTLLAMIAFVTVLLEQAHVQTAIGDKLSSLATGAGAPFSISSFFDINNGIAYVIVLVVLGLAALYNATAAFFGGAETSEPDVNARGDLPPPSPAQPSG